MRGYRGAFMSSKNHLRKISNTSESPEPAQPVSQPNAPNAESGDTLDLSKNKQGHNPCDIESSLSKEGVTKDDLSELATVSSSSSNVSSNSDVVTAAGVACDVSSVAVSDSGGEFDTTIGSHSESSAMPQEGTGQGSSQASISQPSIELISPNQPSVTSHFTSSRHASVEHDAPPQVPQHGGDSVHGPENYGPYANVATPNNTAHLNNAPQQSYLGQNQFASSELYAQANLQNHDFSQSQQIQHFQGGGNLTLCSYNSNDQAAQWQQNGVFIPNQDFPPQGLAFGQQGFNRSPVPPYVRAPNYLQGPQTLHSSQMPQGLQETNGAPNVFGNLNDLPLLVKSADGKIMMQKPHANLSQMSTPDSSGQDNGAGHGSMAQPPMQVYGQPQYGGYAQNSGFAQNGWQPHNQMPQGGLGSSQGIAPSQGNITSSQGNSCKSQENTRPSQENNGPSQASGGGTYTPKQEGVDTMATQNTSGASKSTYAYNPNASAQGQSVSPNSNVMGKVTGQAGFSSGASTPLNKVNSVQNGHATWQLGNYNNQVINSRAPVSSEKWYESLGAHILLVCIITLLLLIPASFFSWVLADRESNQHYAVESMTEAWGGEQFLADPELIISVMVPSEIEVRGENSRGPRGVHENRFIRPKKSETVVKLSSEKRYKGNYEATLYTLDVTQSGFFDLEAGKALLESDSRVNLMDSDDLRIGFNVDDNKGIDEIKSIEINGRPYEAIPSDEFTGFEVLVPKIDIGANNRLNFKANFLVRGSQLFAFYPLSQVSELKITAEGAIPNFTGSFLPREREVNTKERTFTANYYQNNLSTGQAMVSSSVLSTSQSHIRIELFDDADSYVLIARLTKYVLLFIAMTYVTVLAFEIASKRLVSLVQYVVIGVALILFYLVLLSFSEHFSFVFSYLVGAITLSLMISLYIKAVFDSKKHAICLFIMLLAMYAVLFAIVHIEAYALLVGTILLVIMLGVVMYITRHINRKPIIRQYADSNKS